MTATSYKQLNLDGKIRQEDLEQAVQDKLDSEVISDSNESVTFYCDCDNSTDVTGKNLISCYSDLSDIYEFDSVSDFDTSNINTSDKKFGDASFNFNRSNYSLLIPKDGNISLDGKFSISVWIKVNGEISRTIYSDVDGILKLLINSSGNAVASLIDKSGTTRSVTSTTSVNSNSWINIIVSGETNSLGVDSLSIYINGDLEDSITDQTINVNENTLSNFILGSDFNNDNATVINMGSLPSFDGMIFSGDNEGADCDVSGGELTIDTTTKGSRTASYEKSWSTSFSSDIKLALSGDYDCVSLTNLNPIQTVNIDKSVRRVGRGSLSFNGSSDYVSFADSSDWDIVANTTEDWTIEMFVNFKSLSGDQILITHVDGSSGRWSFRKTASNNLEFIVYDGGWYINLSNASGISAENTWYHVALVKKGVDYGIYINGSKAASVADSSTRDFSGLLMIGGDADSGTFLNGNIDDLKMTKSNVYNVDPSTSDSFSAPVQSVIQGCYYETKTKLLTVESGSAMPSNTVLMLPADVDNKSIAGRNPLHVTNLDTVNKKFGDASLKFNGSSDYVGFADSDNWDIFGSNSDSWTISMWVKHTDHVSDEYYISQYEDSSNVWHLFHSHGNGLSMYAVSGGTTILDTGFGGEITDTDWHHIALVKINDEYAIYLDGTQVVYLQDSSTDILSGKLFIGQRGSNSNYFDGNIDDIVISQSNIFSASPNSGNTDTISVPSNALDKTSDTRLMARGDDTCNSIDSYAVSSHSTALSKSIVKFGNGAMKFNGSSDYVSFADSSDWDLFKSTSESWTISLWVRHLDHVADEVYVGQYQGSGNEWYIRHEDGAGLRLRAFSGSSIIVDSGAGGEITDTNWHHIALVKINDEYAIYLDGTQVNYTQDTSTLDLSGSLYIGAKGQPNDYFYGYIDDVVISKSNAFSASPNSGNTDTITVPTVALTDDSATKLHITADSNCNSSEGKNATHTTTIFSIISKFGDDSLVFDGSSDYVQFDDSDNWDVVKDTTSDFTISFFVKHNSVSNGQGYFSQHQDDDNMWNLSHDSNGLLFFSRYGGGSDINTGSGGVISDTSWHHVAMIKKGNIYACYLDGQQVNYTTTTYARTFSAPLHIGKYWSSGYHLDGYMDDIVVSNNNFFNANPNSGKTDTIAVPTSSLSTTNGVLEYKISNGLFESSLQIKDNSVVLIGDSDVSCNCVTTSSYNTYRHVLKGARSFLYVNGVLQAKNIAKTSSNNKIIFGDLDSTDGLNIKAMIENYKYNNSYDYVSFLYSNELNGNIDSFISFDSIVSNNTIEQLQTEAGKDIVPNTIDGSQIRNIGNSHLAIQDLIDQREYEESTYIDLRGYADTSGVRVARYVQFSTKKRVIPTVTTVITNSTNLDSISAIPKRNGINFGLSSSSSGYVRWEGSWSAQCASIAKIYDITDTDFKCITGKPLFDSVGQKIGYDDTEFTVLLSNVVKDDDSLTYSFIVDGVQFVIPMTNEEQRISWIYGLDSDHLSAQSLKLVQKLTDSSEYENIQSTLRTNSIQKSEIRNEFLKYYEKVKKIRTNIYTSLENFVLNNKELILSRIDAGEKYLQNGDL